MARAGDVNGAEEWLQKMLQVRAGALADWVCYENLVGVLVMAYIMMFIYNGWDKLMMVNDG